MAFQHFEHVMAPEGTVDAMRELIEEAVRVLRAAEVAVPEIYGVRMAWLQEQARPFLNKARAALGEEASNG